MSKTGVLSMNKRGQDFALIFSIVVGALIIIMGFYTASNFIQISNLRQRAEIANRLDIVLNPFSSLGENPSLALGKPIEMPENIALNFSCSGDSQKIKVTANGGTSSYESYGKYIFSENLMGKKFYIFSKPLEMPWKVDNLMYLISKEYCFINDVPKEIEQEIRTLKSDKLTVSSTGCPDSSTTVCFGSRQCDINVDYGNGIVEKQNAEIPFAGDALMYAAIFSSPEVYSCNLQRLLSRLDVQSDIYINDCQRLALKGCDNSALEQSINVLKENLGYVLADPMTISDLKNAADDVQSKNRIACPVF